MQSDDPAFLTVGTEVSAKFKGAFCEAKVKKVTKSIRIKVILKESPFGNLIVDENAISKNAKLEINEIVDVIQGKQTLRAVIQNIKDCSKYHVVFNDGDEKELRRTQLCLKGGRHFDAAVNLDALPLYNPEQFSSPVMRGAKGKHNKKRKGDESASPTKRKKRDDDEEESDEEGSKKREKRAAASAATMAITEISGISAGGDTTEDSSADSSEEREKKKQRKEEEKKEKKKPYVGLHEKFLVPGSCVVVFEESQSSLRIKESIYASSITQSSEGPSSSSFSPPSPSSPLSSPKASIPSSLYSVFYKRQWWPAVVVAPSAYKKYSNKLKEEKDKDQIHVRRFSDGKYFIRNVSFMIPFSWLPTFSKKKIEEIRDNRATTSSPNSSSSESVDFSVSIELAYAFIDSGKLPKNWQMKEVRGGNLDSPITNRKKEEKKDKEREKVEERSSEDGSSSEESDTEVTEEERNYFIAQVYKFHEESASPINRVPVLGGKEIDLYQFHRIVQNYGGSKKVTSSGKWGKVLKKMKLKGCSGATSVTIKKAYMRYLEPYSSFESKLGWSAADANSTGPRGERRSLIRPGQFSDNKKQRRKSDAAKNRSSKEGSRRGSKEGSVMNDSIKSESPKPVEEDTRKQGVSESSNVSFVEEKLEEELTMKLEEVKKEQSKSRETSITSTSNQLSPKKKKETTPNRKMIEGGTVGKEKSIEKDEGEKKKQKKEKYGTEKNGPSTSTCPLNNPTIRQKTERKNVGAIPSTDGSGSGEKGDPDEGYRQSNVISHFYMGQKVRANHSGRWYDARVVEIRQSTTLKIGQLLMKDPDTDNFSQEVKDELELAGREVACFVHYLGWNSRYDEWIDLSKLKVSDKDQHTSRNLIRDQFKTISDIKIAMAEYSEKDGQSFEKILESVKESKEIVVVPIEPSPPVLNTIEKKPVPIVTVAPSIPVTLPPPPPDNRTSMSPQGFGSPSRVAAMLSAAATSSSEVTVRDVAAVAVGLEARQRGGRVLLGPASSRNQKTLLHQVSSEAGLQALRSSYVPVTTTATYVAAAEPQKEETIKEEQQKEKPKESEPEPQTEPEPEPEPKPECEPESVVQPEEKEPEPVEPEPIPEPETEPEQPKEIFDRVRTFSRNLTPTKEKEQTSEKTDDLRKSARKSTIASSTASINAQKAAFLAVSGPLTYPTPEKEKEKEKTPPKATTPMYIDTPVVTRKLSTPNEPSTSSALAPPSVTTTKGQTKRKRSGRGGNSGIGSVDRKSHGRTPGKKDDDSDDGEEDGESAHHMTPTVSHRADTFHSLKTRMHKLMEQEGSLNDLSILGLPDYNELLQTTREEDLSDVLEARCYELRDIYTQAKSDIVAMEKKKRRFYEKKREKEKKLRGRSMTPAVSTPSTSNDL